jgi:hypothetical protein
LEAGAAKAIAAALSAFEGETRRSTPRSTAGSCRLTPSRSWLRIGLEGSRGLPEREFAGPVDGLAQRVSDGLALLDHRCREARSRSGALAF